jgi:hypothetical protein
MAMGKVTVVHEIMASDEPQLSRPDELTDLLAAIGR